MGRKQTEETKRKISEANKGRRLSEETRKKISENNRGRVCTEETRQKLSEIQKQIWSDPEKRQMQSEAQKGSRNSGWKGDDASYWAMHDWLKSEYGSPTICEECGGNGNGKAVEYALKKGKTHSRDPENYRKLCKRCHRMYDFADREGPERNLAR